MAKGGSASRPLLALFDVGAVGSMGDGELLGRFLRRDDSASSAFEALVGRHGRMVHRVCYDVLGDPHDAQDAAQATFFLLARKAETIREPEALPSWLHGTARRVASRALRESIRRRKHERRGAELSDRGSAGSDDDGRKTWPELHEELARLPDRYREPIVLCDLSGMTHEEAAGRLGCPPRTLQTRLYRGRERLKARLVRRGVSPSAALLGVSSRVGSLPAGWAASTSGAAVSLIAKSGWAAAEAVSAVASRMARDYLKEMAMLKSKWVAGVGLLVGVLGGGAWSMVPNAGDDPAKPAVVPQPQVLDVNVSKPQQDDFERTYVLADGEDVKVLADAAIVRRNRHYANGGGKQIGLSFDPSLEHAPISVFYRWEDGRRRWSGTVSGFGDGVALADLLGMAVGVDKQEIEGDSGLLKTPVYADFIVRAGAKPDQVVPQLDATLRRELKLPIRLSLAREVRDSIVVWGKFQHKPLPDPKPFPETIQANFDRVDVYARDLGDPRDVKGAMVHGGITLRDFCSDLAVYTGLRVFNEVKPAHNGRIDAHFANFYDRKPFNREEVDLILHHVAEQTGLSFEVQPRRIRILRVERAE